MKKVLTIVLSVAMVICLMPAMAFAADATTTADNTTKATGLAQFSDADSITNKEAVSVLTGLHIINGMGDGTFQPKGDVTRAQTATMISILVRGGDTSSLKAPSQDPFTDVAKDNWAAPYVAYGAQQGYINGMGDGTYAPNNNVTTAQLATILEQILGYSKADVAYQWPENAMAYAHKSGLLTDISKGANDNLDREEAAQMIFNALKADTKVKSTVTGTNGDTEYDSITNKPEQDYRNPSQDATQQLVEKLFPKATLDSSKKVDSFGHAATVWTNGREQITDEVIDNPTYTYTSEQEAKDLKADLKGYDLKTVDVYNNTDEAAKDKDLTIDENPADKDNYKGLDTLTGNGTLIELYTNEKDTAITKAIVVNYKPLEVDSVNSTKGTIALKNGPTITKDASFYDAVKTAAEGDRVLVAFKDNQQTENANDILDAYIATSIKGVVSKSNDKAATVGDKEYSKAANAVATLKAGKNETSVYLDKYGYYVDSDDANATAKKATPAYLYVVGTRQVESDNPKYDPYAPKGDATVENTEKVISYNFIAVDENGNVLSDKALANKSADLDGSQAAKDGATAPSQVEEGFYTYEETAGGYVLYEEDAQPNVYKSAVEDGAANSALAGTKMINGVYVSTDAKTVTVNANMSKTTASAVDGANVAQDTLYKYITKKNADDKTFLTTLFVIKDATSTDSTKVFVKGETGETANFTKKDGTVDTGKQIEYYEPDSADPKTAYVDQNTNVAQGFYNITLDGEGATLENFVPADSVAVEEVYNGTIKLNGVDKAYTLADGAIRDVQTGEDVTKLTDLASIEEAIKKNDVQVVYVEKENADTPTITQLYITNVSEKNN